MKQAERGITLVELLVVVVIVAILASVAIPGYRQYMIRTHRTDAKVALTSHATALERCFTRYMAYDSGSCAAFSSLPETVQSGLYEVRITDTSATTFTLQAVPLGSQVQDEQCATFTLTQAGVRGVSGSYSATPERCWKR